MEKLHPGARWLFRISAYSTVFIVVLMLGFMSVSFLLTLLLGSENSIMIGFLFPFIVALVLMFIFGEIYSNMAYNRWFYEFTPTNLKTEKGIIWKKYSNVPYERVQNVDIRRGILARMLGFSSVMIQTAGASYSPRSGAGAEGSLPAISPKKAEEIREFLMKKITKSHGQGM